jgi:hypothetical protein
MAGRAAAGDCWAVERGATVEVRLAGLEADDFARAVAVLKARIPAWARSWSAERRAWLIVASLADDVRLWADEVGLTLRWDGTGRRTRAWTADELEAFDALWVRPGAPPVVIRAAGRALRRHCRDDVARARLARALRLLDDVSSDPGQVIGHEAVP